ncbi:MAG TPA: TonB-dependent receptor, partial [Nevskiaceae bacterium]|nr:TonB-dependent receptor [Nevskiaceae bacterium]
YFYQIHNTADAVFGQFTWSPEYFARRLHLTAGLRQSWDHRQAIKDYAALEYLEGQAAGQPLAAIPLPATQGNDTFNDVHADKRYSDLSPSLNLQYDFTRSATGYFSVARAYKSGGFNLRDPQISGASGKASDGVNYGFGFVDGFKPERVLSYELGLKSEWFGRRLRVNGDVFDSEYRDMQTNFLISGTISDTKSRNAGRARMRGVELDTTWAAAQGLVLAFDYAYLNTRTLEVIDLNGKNLAGLYPFVSAPPQSYVGSIDWTFLEGGWGSLRAYASYNWTGHREGLVVTEPRRGKTATQGYGLFNARIVAGGVHVGAHGSLDLALWGKNLADVEYPSTAIDNLPQADRAVIWGEPRSFGLDAVYRWD